MQEKLPLIPLGATPINSQVCVHRHDDVWTYFLQMYPIYSHDASDDSHFRLTIAQLVLCGLCRPCEIVTAFGVTKNKVMRAEKQLRERGVKSFFERRRSRKGGTVLTPEKLSEAQRLLDQGAVRQEMASELGVKCDTLRKVINDGRLREPGKSPQTRDSATMSERSIQDGAAADGMGTACTRPEERAFAALGLLQEAPTRFESCLDVPFGEVLSAIPALLSNGLLTGLNLLGTVRGYYTQTQVLLVLAVMCLCRIKTIEKLRHCSPGELGKLLGLDRVPEARCLRFKADQLAGEGEAEEWAAFLSQAWMEKSLKSPGFLYVDGHVKVYSGAEKLPRRYVSRQRLCLRGISTYYINDVLGQPFFVVERQIDHGLLQALRTDIIPRLLRDVPGQPSDEQLEADPHLARFVIVFDREGYSPAFLKEMWNEYRIACITYRKNCVNPWPLEWFTEEKTIMPRGETVKMKLAEAGTVLGKGETAVWVKEIRKLTESGHQTAIASTHSGSDPFQVTLHS